MVLPAILFASFPQFLPQLHPVGLRLLHPPGVIQILTPRLCAIESVDIGISPPYQILEIVERPYFVERQARIFTDQVQPPGGNRILMPCRTVPVTGVVRQRQFFEFVISSIKLR